MPETPHFKVGTIAAVLGLTTRRVRVLVQLGMPQVKRGRYDLAACVQWYVDYRVKAASHASRMDNARLRKLKAEAKKKEIEIRIMEEKLIPVDEVVKTWSNITAAMRAKLLAIPTKAAPMILSITTQAEAQELLKSYIYEALDELTDDLSAIA